jgi:hypothetical protein
MTPSTEVNALVAEWRDARTLYPLYAALGREFVIELPPCADLEAGIDTPGQESVEAARQWLLDVDDRIQVHQLRQFLQTTNLVNDDGLRTLLSHYLHKQKRSELDRDKLDFLLVQYFSHCAPSRLDIADVDLSYVAQTLEPVLGTVDLQVPAWLASLEELIQEAARCKDLKNLLTIRTLDKGRKIKAGAGDRYYLPVAMVAFTRFSFMMRRVFFRLMHQDLNAILDGLRTLGQLGVTTLDCRRAQFSAEEPIARLRMICQSWKVMFHAEYSSGQPLNMLVDLRGVVETALHRTAKSGGQHAKAAAAAAGSTADVPEFEVANTPPGIPEDPSQ